MDGAAEAASEFGDVLGRPIGESVLGLGPDELLRIDLWRIRRKGEDMKPLVLAQEFFDNDALVDGAAVPEQYHRPPQMAKQVPQESDDLHAGDVLAVETKVKPKALARGGYREGGDCGNPIPSVAVSEDGGLPDRRPCLTDVRDEEKSAFVEECEMGAKSSGFFLYSTTRVSSIGRWLSRPSAWRVVPASAKSIQSPPSPARDGRGGSEPRNACRSAWKYAAGSRDPLRIRLPEVLAPTGATVCVSALTLTAADGRTPASIVGHWPHLFENFGPSAPRSLWKRSRLRPRTDRSCRPGARRRHGGGAIRAREGFHGVACPIS